MVAARTPSKAPSETAAMTKVETFKRRPRVRLGPLAHVGRVDYDSRAMLSRAQEARVREILGGQPGPARPSSAASAGRATTQPRGCSSRPGGVRRPRKPAVFHDGPGR